MNITEGDEDLANVVAPLVEQMENSVSTAHRNDHENMSKKQQKKVVMHVNRYVPFFMQYHTLTSQEFNEFQKDYAKRENLAFKQHVIDFDAKLIEIFNSRRDRYIKRFYPDQKDDFDEFEEG
jgi:hypothetical protein